jgi:hypothetical protein
MFIINIINNIYDDPKLLDFIIINNIGLGKTRITIMFLFKINNLIIIS